jgi:hypothetical protein
MAKHANEIIAFHFGWDIKDVSDGRYQPSRFSNPSIYVVGEDYYCAPTAKQKLPKDFKWTEIAEWYDRKVYRALASGE